MNPHKSIACQVDRDFFSDIYASLWMAVKEQTSQDLGDVIWQSVDQYIPMWDVLLGMDSKLHRIFQTKPGEQT